MNKKERIAHIMRKSKIEDLMMTMMKMKVGIFSQKNRIIEKNNQCDIRRIIPESDFKKFVKLCTNIFRGVSELKFFYSEKRPLLFCQFI